MTEQLFLTVREAALASSTGETVVRLACEAGTLPAADIGTGRSRHWRIEPADLIEWVRSGAPTSTTERTRSS